MAKPKQRRHSLLRRAFRWGRICILTLILVAVIAGIYVTTIGLPEFVKGPLLAKLRAEGVDLDFRRIRWIWYRGVVAEESSFTWLKDPNQPNFSSAETELDLDLRSLFKTRLRLNSITIKNGNLLWPVAKTNDLELSLSNVTARIEFPTTRTIEIVRLAGDSVGAHIKLTGVITNFEGVRAWKIFRPLKDRPGEENLSEIATTLQKLRLTGEPELVMSVSGDAGEPKSMRGSIKFTTRRAQTPWGNVKNLQFTSELRDLLNTTEKTVFRVKADALEKTAWGSASNLTGFARISPGIAGSPIFQTELRLSGKHLRTELGTAGSFQFFGRTSQSLSNLMPSSIRGKANLVSAETKWGKAGTAEITFTAATNTAAKRSDESWAFWRDAEPFSLNWESRFSKVETPEIKMDKLSSAGSWRAPTLVISNLDARLYSGGIQSAGQLNVATREADVKLSSNFDVRKVSHLLSPDAQRWLGEVTWAEPPKLQGSMNVILPAWTNQTPDWAKEVLPTLALHGNLAVERATYRQIPANSVKTDFAYSNRVWTVPNLFIDRPEGSAELSLVTSELSGEFHGLIRSTIDPKAVRPLLTEPQQQMLDDLRFSTPPRIHVDIRGRWNELEKCSGTGEIAIANFSFQTNTVEKLTASLGLTNQQLHVSSLRLEHAGKAITAETVAFDFPTKKVFFTNVFSTVDPYLVTRLIGDDVAENVAPYKYTDPPEIHLNGSLTIGNIDDADLHFDVAGGQFQWKQFIADKISGRVDWQGPTLLVTNVQADIYRGRTVGWAYFEFNPGHGADYRFDLAATEIDLRSLVGTMTGKTNHLEGSLQGTWTLSSGNTDDPKTMRGSGNLNVREGLFWDVPIFGIFSPMLNAILPGAGNSRAHDASAQFVVGNGMVYSDNLEIRAPALRMQYRGAVDFEQNVDARVEAELLRDTWLIGRLVSLVLTPLTKLFEYKVTGTLSQPESEPVYIPNILMMTLRPFHSIKKVLAPDKVVAPPAIPAPMEKP